jgi:hypothetical protein
MAVRGTGAERDLAAVQNDPPVIFCGTKVSSVSAGLTDGILWIRVENEPTGADVAGCIRQALDKGLLATGADTIVDLTRFRGVVDWGAVHAIRDMAPWGSGQARQARVAYVSTDRMVATLIKLVTSLFPSARHRLFTDYADALAWLRAARKESGQGPV